MESNVSNSCRVVKNTLLNRNRKKLTCKKTRHRHSYRTRNVLNQLLGWWTTGTNTSLLPLCEAYFFVNHFWSSITSSPLQCITLFRKDFPRFSHDIRFLYIQSVKRNAVNINIVNVYKSAPKHHFLNTIVRLSCKNAEIWIAYSFLPLDRYQIPVFVFLYIIRVNALEWIIVNRKKIWVTFVEGFVQLRRDLRLMAKLS